MQNKDIADAVSNIHEEVNMKKYNINVLLVDDDGHALTQSKSKIEIYVPPERIFTATNSVEIMRIVESVPIDLAFLDVEMPDTDGFFVANYLQENQPKAKYVFLTGHVELGAKSYDYEPLDFLCKPMDVMRLQKTFERFARTRQGAAGREERIAIEAAAGLVMIYPSEISYITRENRKSVIYCGDQKYTVRSSLDELELIFSDFGLFRCHQSYLIPLGKIRQVKPSEFGRTFWAVLDTGDRIPVGRSKYAPLRQEISEYGARFI